MMVPNEFSEPYERDRLLRAAFAVGAGIRQSTGIADPGPVHEVVDQATEEAAGEIGRDACRWVYVDVDPLAHAQVAVAAKGDPSRRGLAKAAFQHPRKMWRQVTDTQLIDVAEPVALVGAGAAVHRT